MAFDAMIKVNVLTFTKTCVRATDAIKMYMVT